MSSSDKATTMSEPLRRLCDLCPGECGILRAMDPTMSLVVEQRLRALGLYEGASITVAYRAPLRDPVAYRFCDATICLRRAQARLLQIELTDATESIIDDAEAFQIQQQS